MQKNLTTGNIFKNLIYFSLPYLLSSFLQTFYGMADLFIAGQFNGSPTISAISTGSQIMHMLTVILVGLAMGTTVLISRAVGACDKEKINETIGNSVTLFIGVSLFFTAVLLICTNGIVSVMSVPSAAVKEARSYLTICFAGIPFITAYNIISCIFRGLGDSKTPMYFIAIACAANIALDYLFIGYLHMGAAGAAFGTVLAQTISVLCSLLAIKKKNTGITLSRNDFRIKKDICSSIFRIGVPISLQDGFIQISFIIITIIANERGLIISTAVGIVEKVIGFLFLIPSAMLSAISAIAAQNIGANEYERARKTLFFGTAVAVSFGLVFFVLCQFISGNIVGLFSDDTEVIRMGTQYLRSYSLDCAIAAVHFCFSGFFCAHGRSVISFVHNLCSIIVIRIPGAYLASKWFPDSLFEMGLAAPLGSLLSACICIFVYFCLRNKKQI
ncbi:MAG: MATE family efflux transporter [Eubacteriales bacterium]|nr:MATE family efflux transporter [Eubacteriales bacterium]